MAKQPIAYPPFNSPFAATSPTIELTLFDKAWTWPTETREAMTHVPKDFFEADISKREVASKISKMKLYSPREEEEERRKGVSTRLGLHPYYPWNIKKKLTLSLFTWHIHIFFCH
ncbi:hypothetical protein Pint_14628 [Pistacia integerrima]|uniref:Uncharacterized protein n=1 Tax=Pistacia integerrima TaxID=434235 RepID=A0ACC0Y6T9_9ROSI|nr:hypothetical protein Pint_14628 [Pistacia integerrima]